MPVQEAFSIGDDVELDDSATMKPGIKHGAVICLLLSMKAGMQSSHKNDLETMSESELTERLKWLQARLHDLEIEKTACEDEQKAVKARLGELHPAKSADKLPKVLVAEFHKRGNTLEQLTAFSRKLAGISHMKIRTRSCCQLLCPRS